MGLARPPPQEGLCIPPSAPLQTTALQQPLDEGILPVMPSRGQSCTAAHPSPLDYCSSASLSLFPGVCMLLGCTGISVLPEQSGLPFFPNHISCCGTNLCKSIHKPAEIKPLPDFTGQAVLGRTTSHALESSPASTSFSTMISSWRASIFLRM